MKRYLAIESSCDETAAAVVCGTEVEASIVASQHEVHAAYGGVVPELASRRHLEVVDGVVAAALAGARGPIDAVAATRGPGLVGSLLVGWGYALGVAAVRGIPVVPVDHLLAHVLSIRLADDPPEPPLLCLLASGGHTLLLGVGAGWTLELLGTSRDDAAGEAFDKGARLLGLAQPGGPAIEQLARGHTAAVPGINPAMVGDPSCDMSFAGLKTALLLALRDPDHPPAAELAAAYEQAICETILAACDKALRRGPWTTLAVVGGVAANARLRRMLEDRCRETDVRMVAAPLEYCGDNAAMVGVAAAHCPQLAVADAALLDVDPASALSRDGRLDPTTIP